MAVADHDEDVADVAAKGQGVSLGPLANRLGYALRRAPMNQTNIYGHWSHANNRRLSRGFFPIHHLYSSRSPSLGLLKNVQRVSQQT